MERTDLGNYTATCLMQQRNIIEACRETAEHLSLIVTENGENFHQTGKIELPTSPVFTPIYFFGDHGADRPSLRGLVNIKVATSDVDASVYDRVSEFRIITAERAPNKLSQRLVERYRSRLGELEPSVMSMDEFFLGVYPRYF
ncbi:hypothetical protein HYU08_01315 [Candidatus Woesearchaeota archaeon]|nr:hypothetical protein [Candidatus Woesearchaeota archaeon]